jgi:hypothetical protein
VHKDTVVAAVRCVSMPPHQEVRSFATTTAGLFALAEWLTGHACTHVAMEATGVYWKPVWHVLEGDFTLVLANAQHVRNVPGRKTDVGDARGMLDVDLTAEIAQAAHEPGDDLGFVTTGEVVGAEVAVELPSRKTLFLRVNRAARGRPAFMDRQPKV